MAKNYFNRYVWLIDVISRYGHITKRDIDGLWSSSSLNDNHETAIPERAFHNHREAIRDIFGIEIGFDRGRGYYIVNTEDLDGEGIRNWLLESMSLSNILRESADMRSRILFEKVPSSSKWLAVIVNAMRDGKALELPAGFDAADFFSDYFGIIIGHNVQPGIMEIKASFGRAGQVPGIPAVASQSDGH